MLDNAHGKFPPIPPGSAWGGEHGAWWISADCPLHDEPLPDETEGDAP